jgi:hypothetical protein
MLGNDSALSTEDRSASRRVIELKIRQLRGSTDPGGDVGLMSRPAGWPR